MNHNINTGGIISPPDYRDSIASLSIASAPSIQLPPVLNTELGRPVLMQSKIPACVSHSVVDVLKLWWFRKTGVWANFSPRFLDILSAEPDIPLDGGRRPRTVFKVALNSGCCTEATLKNDTTLSVAKYRDKNAISAAAYAEAKKYRIPGFISINLDFKNMRNAIYLYGALSTLFAVGEEMYVPSWLPKDTDPLRIPKNVISGHQMTPKGWSSPTLNILRNSWSENWGNKGETEYNHNQWEPFIFEAWTPAEVPTDVVTFMKTLPSPRDFHYVWNTNLSLGQFNDDVKFLQVALMILGFLKPISAEDLGHYGPKTAVAVLAYQQYESIYPTAPNSVGVRTRAALNKRFMV